MRTIRLRRSWPIVGGLVARSGVVPFAPARRGDHAGRRRGAAGGVADGGGLDRSQLDDGGAAGDHGGGQLGGGAALPAVAVDGADAGDPLVEV